MLWFSLGENTIYHGLDILVSEQLYSKDASETKAKMNSEKQCFDSAFSGQQRTPGQVACQLKG